ncbi:MAG TPA: hypothetical protein EYP60_05200, partial [bacterium (Candidatus Stahlbacteria)]|nr:hypothetical protein [Candidatus Stahlbacteria bacterium]
MKNKLKVVFILSCVIFWNASITAQVTKQEAIDFVTDTIYANTIDSISVYMDSNAVSDNYYMLSKFDSIQAPYDEYWLFFIDKQPRNYAWGHECAYVFIDVATGNYTELESESPPFLYFTKLEHISLAYTPTVSYNDFTGGPLTFTYPEENEHLFAVLFATTGTSQTTTPYIWNNLSHMYSALKNSGYPDTNIYILFHTGIPLGDSTHFPKLDLNNDGNNDILENVVCNVNNLDSIFKDVLKPKMGYDDLLFVYSHTHGTMGSDTNDTYLELWEKEPLHDTVLAPMIEQVKYSELVYINEACHGGGIIDNFSGVHQTVITPVEWALSIFNDGNKVEDLGFTPYSYALITTLRGEHPFHKSTPWLRGPEVGKDTSLNNYLFFDHVSQDFKPDSSLYGGNEDGVLQINEAITYTDTLVKSFDTSGVHMYNSGFQSGDDLLSLTGISGNVDTSQIIEGSFIIGGNLNLEAGTTLTVDDETKLYLVNGNISTEGGSTLILKDDVLVHNFSEEASFFVNGAIQGDTTAGTDVEYVTFSSAPATSLFMGVLTDATFSACEIDRVILSSGGHHLFGAYNLTINQSSFNNSLIQGSGHYVIDNCTFSQTSLNLYLVFIFGWNCSAFIKNSSFYLPHPDKNNILIWWQ